MVLGFDALGDDLDAERMADIDDGADELTLAFGLGDGHDELPIDLEPARLQLEQADDRSVAGAEIVHFDIDTQLADLVDVECDEIIVLVEIDGFDQLERYRAGGDVELAQALDEVLITQPPGGDVDRCAGNIEALGAPDMHPAEGLLEDEPVDRADHVEVFRDRHEKVGRHDPAGGMPPAGQSLDPGDTM